MVDPYARKPGGYAAGTLEIGIGVYMIGPYHRSIGVCAQDP